MTRLTLDSNVHISAIKFGGLPLTILQMAGTGEIEVAILEPIIAEVIRVLRDKFGYPADKLESAERSLRMLCTLVTPDRTLNVVPDDEDDNRVVECALASESEAIVTGDKHLLSMGRYERILMLRVREFLERKRQ